MEPGTSMDSLATIKWYLDEEFYWRSLASGVWLILMVPLTFTVFLLAVNFSIYSPIVWFTDTLSQLLSTQGIFICLLLQVCCIFPTIAHARSLNVCKRSHDTIWKAFLHGIQPRQLVNILCLVSCSVLMSFLLLSTYQYNSRMTSGFQLSCSFILSLLYSTEFYQKHNYVAEFPIIQQKRFFRLKKEFHLCFVDSIKFSLKVLQFYYPFRFLVSICLLLFANSTPGNQTQSVSIWTMTMEILSIQLFWYNFCASVFITLVLKMSNQLVKLFNTQVFNFPLQVVLADQRGKTLADAMESTNLMLKYLACLDYYSLSKKTGPRRRKMFELFPPGNQPYVWNRTSTECLRIMAKTCTELKFLYQQKQMNKVAPNRSTPLVKNVGIGQLFSPTNESSETLRVNKPGNILSPEKKDLKSSVMPKTQNSANMTVKELERKEHEIFDKLQLLLWCIEGLCNVVAASILEDTYGVVQQKLPDILTELLLLLEVCDLYTKVAVTPTTAMYGIDRGSSIATSAASLKLALKNGLYTITTAFGYHISAVRLASEHKKRLHAFLEFTE